MDHKKYIQMIASLGGHARAKSLTSERRKEIAQKANLTRRLKNLLAKQEKTLSDVARNEPTIKSI
jgi:hypothetical protein